MIEITTIGAGGGLIAFVDRGGLLQVGPESAGSVPGPACYGTGGDRPTLTDANVVLGRIKAERPIGGKLARLNFESARRTILSHVGEPLGLDAEAAAAAIVRAANARMAGALRQRGGFIVSTHFTLVPGRGGEPLISPHLKALGRFCARTISRPAPGGMRSSTSSRPPTSRSRRSPIPPST
jgi:N-methylhydantoinase A